ncbi:N1221-domain-containing protein [Xylona heveae TC161]|uniref:N1221-domain-containing protein n=1 Tax=Xylona heveae (strain CBS 132557 / TC161) TaxID=1328760 RepID=A0A165FUG0_XYLHT|nr:N1221-domain-containing protein [Xylona heveae TC161]KZF21395.1 N1221-domain-containing protein [Xylona heveae TC161]
MDAADSGDIGPAQVVHVKADEVDETGADIATRPTDVGDTGVGIIEELGDPSETTDAPKAEEEQPTKSSPTKKIALPVRPTLRRDQSSQPPPLSPSPSAPFGGQQQSFQPESLSLTELKRLVAEIPKSEPTAYAFVYGDAASFPEELEEWFTYGYDEIQGLLCAKASFEERWGDFLGRDISMNGDVLGWTQASASTRSKFVGNEVASLEHPDIRKRVLGLESLAYIAMGAWGELGGSAKTENEPKDASGSDDTHEKGASEEDDACHVQMRWMLNGAETIYERMGAQVIFDVMRGACLKQWEKSNHLGPVEESDQEQTILEIRELRASLTLLYFLIEAGRWQCEFGEKTSLRDELSSLEPNFLVFLVKMIAKFRWDEAPELPLHKLLLLFWKSVLLIFGGNKDLQGARTALKAGSDRVDEYGDPLITASPLDYHLFRQEITSKYPAYNPPPPLLPLEPENNSILPPLSTHPDRANNNSANMIYGSGPGNVNKGGSILHQPVHIATPAPSPPPSPVGPGGKAGKKQNYQTNQNFPFLYPPLDSTSNNIGGKGGADMQDILVGKRWEGSDIPASILEAGVLFASRMRMTRAMRQLWEERERFMKYERGWGEVKAAEGHGDGAYSPFEKVAEQNEGSVSSDESIEADVTERLNRIEDFYRHALPHLQSLVIVLLKVVLANVTQLLTQPNGVAGQNAFPLANLENQDGQDKGADSSGAIEIERDGNPNAERVVDEIDNVRTQEISSKAVSGVLLLLLKWFKISHILKFEYLTQLLLDSNYLPLILKLFAHQEIERTVDNKNDQDELGFFHFCRLHAGRKDSATSGEEQEVKDEIYPIPPVIRLRRNQFSDFSNPAELLPSRPPEVDELGYPTSDLPAEPITNYSWRNFFSSINYLRIMQKICKDKAHRNLLLVQYKSSTILRKALKVPQHHLRLYTLKLFKNQVPYCGRKWRQSNMRVITAVYLHCRPDLRDDWLAGSDIDAEVEEALPLEQALRGLTHWHNLDRYPEQMGAQEGILEEERDFFVKELEKMDWGEDLVAPFADEASAGLGDQMWAPNTGVPMQHMEGWS